VSPQQGWQLSLRTYSRGAEETCWFFALNMTLKKAIQRHSQTKGTSKCMVGYFASRSPG